MNISINSDEVSHQEFEDGNERVDYQLSLGKTNGICFAVTVFNETPNEFALSLSALVDNIDKLASVGLDNSSMRFTIVVICDGKEFIHPGTLALFAKFGFLIDADQVSVTRSILKEFSTDVIRGILGESQPSLIPNNDSILNQLSADNFTDAQCQPVEFLLVVKEKNLGKLNSHWHFYNVICVSLKPDYCVQIDVGTVPRIDALSVAIGVLQNDLNCAAVSPFIMANSGIVRSKLLELWQLGGFAKAGYFDWKLESFSGYLSVIPGQFSVIRWSSIYFDTNGANNGKSPLDTYFEGLRVSSPFESNLYLAEDRVLCSGIFLKSNESWRIRYDSKCVAITDTCKSWEELFRQRRRWNLGFLAARLNFLSQLWDRIKSGTNGGRMKNDVAVFLYHSIQFLLDWLTPSVIVSIYIFMRYVNIDLLGDFYILKIASELIFAGTVLTTMACFFLSLSSGLSYKYLSCFKVSIALQIAYIVLSGALISVYLVPNFVTATVGLAVFFLIFKIGFKRIFEASLYFLIRAPISLHVWMYAITNCHDSSWGTKGLHQSAISGSCNSKKGFSKYRRNVLMTWLATNILTILAAVIMFQNI